MTVSPVAEGVGIPIMNSLPRPPSSVYSDQFQLEDLVEEISRWTFASQQEQVLLGLLEQQKTLQAGLETARNQWFAVNQVMLHAAETAFALHKLVGDARQGVKEEEQNWMVNCTTPI